MKREMRVAFNMALPSGSGVRVATIRGMDDHLRPHDSRAQYGSRWQSAVVFAVVACCAMQQRLVSA